MASVLSVEADQADIDPVDQEIIDRFFPSEPTHPLRDKIQTIIWGTEDSWGVYDVVKIAGLGVVVLIFTQHF